MLQYAEYFEHSVDKKKYQCILQEHFRYKFFQESNCLNQPSKNLRKTCFAFTTLIRTIKVKPFKMQLKNSILLWFALCSLLCSGVWPSEAGRTSSAHRMHRSRKHVEGEPLRCEAIEIPQCRDIGYNHTDMALSPANMVKQSDAAPVVSTSLMGGLFFPKFFS